MSNTVYDRLGLLLLLLSFACWVTAVFNPASWPRAVVAALVVLALVLDVGALYCTLRWKAPWGIRR
jgi:energy-coupling factor transporter transmembrane protein EcfT